MAAQPQCNHCDSGDAWSGSKVADCSMLDSDSQVGNLSLCHIPTVLIRSGRLQCKISVDSCCAGSARLWLVAPFQTGEEEHPPVFVVRSCLRIVGVVPAIPSTTAVEAGFGTLLPHQLWFSADSNIAECNCPVYGLQLVP